MTRPDPKAELVRDIQTLKAELHGRCDQLVADYNERFRELDAMTEQAEGGDVDVRATQARLRQLLNDRGGSGAGGTVRAGRTTIGMPVPHKPSPMPATPSGPHRLSPTPVLAEAALNKTLNALDVRLVGLLAKTRDKSEREEARLELGLLLQTRRSLERQSQDGMPTDPVLLQTVMDYADEAQLMMSDLDQLGQPRLKRLIAHARELASQLIAFGTAVAPLKEQLVRAQKHLSQTPANEKAALTDALAAFGKLKDELDKRFPLATPSLLDDLQKL